MLQPTRKVPLYLFLRGVYKSDCLDTVSETIDTPYCDMKVPIYSASIDYTDEYTKNPNIFESLDTWPQSTNLRCWYCFNQFLGPPKFIPIVIEPNIRRDTKYEKNKPTYSISVEGNFCRWPCCMSYIKETTQDLNKYIEKSNNLYFLYYIWNGSYPKFIPMAPTKYLQNIFGGDLTTQKYYELYNQLEDTITQFT